MSGRRSEYMLDWIRRDLGAFGITFDDFASELSIFDRDLVAEALAVIRPQDHQRVFHHPALLEGVEEPADRPVTFLWNGGPGSCAVWLHMGAFGPKRVVVPSEAEDDGVVRVGLDDFAQKLVGIPRRLELPRVGSRVEQGAAAISLAGPSRSSTRSPTSSGWVRRGR